MKSKNYKQLTIKMWINVENFLSDSYYDTIYSRENLVV